jgi:holo-[acyl-carrier protein] synthase
MSTKIKGIGNDIIEIDRIEKAIDRHNFIDKIFTSNEKKYCLKFSTPAPHFAARFAAKEAVAKALGCGIGSKLSWLDIEIINNDEGKPCVFLSEKANLNFQKPEILITLSHAKSYASAVAIII